MDQFADVTEPVFRTRNRKWHAQYTRIGGRRIANLDWFVDGINAAEAQMTYRELRRRAAVVASAS